MQKQAQHWSDSSIGACQSPKSSHSEQFSFSKAMALSSGKQLSLREDLLRLPKQDLVDIVIEQIEQTKLLRIKIGELEERNKIMQSYRCDNDPTNQQDSLDGQMVSMAKYRELSEYVDEYIKSMNENQAYMMAVVAELKTSNKGLKHENGLLQGELESMRERAGKCREYEAMVRGMAETIKNLEDSVSHYVVINNQSTKKYEKLRKAHENLETELTMQQKMKKVQKQNQSILSQTKHKSLSYNSKQHNSRVLRTSTISSNQQTSAQRLKIYEIQNRQLRLSMSALQKALEKKSQKIRNLLEELQKLSEQKWQYKQKYMQLKSKNYMQNNSTSGSNNSQGYDSQAQVGEFVQG